MRGSEFSNVQLIFPTLPHLKDYILSYIKDLPHKVYVISGQGLTAEEAAEQRFTAFSSSKAALAASGTVSLELAAVGTPMVIAYDMNRFSRWVINSLLRVDTVNLVNLISKTRDIPELLGKDCRVELIRTELERLLKNPNLQTAVFKKTMDLLGRGDDQLEDRAALAILEKL